MRRSPQRVEALRASLAETGPEADNAYAEVERLRSDLDGIRKRIRRLVTNLEAQEPDSEIAEDIRSRLEEVFPRPEEIRHAMNSMPSFDVAVTIKVAYHRDPAHRWTTNDIADIDALGSALPYCDVVITDKAVASNVKRAKLPERLGTVVLSRLSDLVHYM